MIELNAKHYVSDEFYPYYQSDEGFRFEISRDNQFLIVDYDKEKIGEVEELVIPNEASIEGTVYPVTEISRGFRDCNKLTSVTFPANLKSIGSDAFKCKVVRDNGYETERVLLKYVFFNGCKDLKNNITYMDEIERIDYDCIETFLSIPQRGIIGNKTRQVFVSGKEITDLVVPEGTIELPEDLMYSCSGLRSVTLPNSIKRIGSCAFCRCKNLVTINLPDGLEELGSFAFLMCDSLEKISVPSSLTILKSSVFSDCKKLVNIELAEGLEEIGSGAFKNTALESISLPESLKTIYVEAFESTPLKKITLPSKLTTICKNIFNRCDNLTDVYSHITNPADCEIKPLGDDCFYSRATLHIPNAKGLLTAYKKKAAWKKFSNIVMDL